MNHGLAVCTRGLTRRFGRLVAVDNLDLRIARSQIFGVLGPNGSGKSTTIRMLCGLLVPSAGEAEVLGLRVPYDAELLRRKIGYMTQSFSLYEDLSIRENLEFVAAIQSLPARRQRSRVDALLDEFALTTKQAQRAGTLSGGQKQRLALAAATLHRPELLFLDEPTSGVDPQSRRDFWERLFAIADDGTTILVSTHYMDEAERCHELAIFDRGRIVAQGSPADLSAKIPATAIEIAADDVRRAQAVLMDLPDVESVTHVGASLHALLRSGRAEAEARTRAAFAAAGVEARIEVVAATLEDVFVAATRGRHDGVSG